MATASKIGPFFVDRPNAHGPLGRCLAFPSTKTPIHPAGYAGDGGGPDPAMSRCGGRGGSKPELSRLSPLAAQTESPGSGAVRLPSQRRTARWASCSTTPACLSPPSDVGRVGGTGRPTGALAQTAFQLLEPDGSGQQDKGKHAHENNHGEEIPLATWV
jgi:hypothetical protein